MNDYYSHKQKKETNYLISFRELGGSRTHNRLIRSQGLYPIELPVQLISSANIQFFFILSIKKILFFKKKINSLIIMFKAKNIGSYCFILWLYNHTIHGIFTKTDNRNITIVCYLV